MIPSLHVSSKPTKKKVYEGFLEVQTQLKSIKDIVSTSLCNFLLLLFMLGVVPPLITVSIIKSISFTVYERSKAFAKQTQPSIFDKHNVLSTMAVSTTAGSISGAFIAALSCPFELVKIQKQLEYLLRASSISTGDLTMTRPVNELKPTINRTVGAGLPVTPTSIPPLPRDTIPCNIHKRSMYTSTSSLHSAREILKKRGIMGLYSGFKLHLRK